MNIGMLLNAPYPSDLRVHKEASALLDAGFSVYLLCLRKTGEKFQDEVNGIKISRIDAGENNMQLAFWDVLMSATSVHPKFKQALKSWVVRNNINVLHVHDLPLVGTALAVKKKLNIPVISDFHENYPEALRTWFEWKKNPVARLKNKLFMNPGRWTVHERNAVQKCDHVIAVVEEMKERLIRDYHISTGKVTVITNSEEIDFTHQQEDPSIYNQYANKFIITYSGNIGPHRGVDTVVDAMKYLKKLPIALVIVGSGGSEVMKNLHELSVSLGVNDNVHFLGRQPFTKFYSFMKFTNVNVIPHKSNGHTDNTIPHKLFQAMMVGKPVLVSSSTPLKRIVNQTQTGLVFEAGDSKSCSEKILQLYNDRNLCEQLGKNGPRVTLHGNMNWEHTKENLINLYRSINQR